MLSSVHACLHHVIQLEFNNFQTCCVQVTGFAWLSPGAVNRCSWSRFYLAWGLHWIAGSSSLTSHPNWWGNRAETRRRANWWQDVLERTISMPQWTTSQNRKLRWYLARPKFSMSFSDSVHVYSQKVTQPSSIALGWRFFALFASSHGHHGTWWPKKPFAPLPALSSCSLLTTNRVGYRSLSSLSLCFTTTIHKSNDLPPKSQDPRAIIEASQRMCIQASKSRDGVGMSRSSIKYPSSSCPAQDIKHINKHQQITGSTGKNSGNKKAPHTPWRSEPIMKPFDWQISLPSPHFQCLEVLRSYFK